MGGGGRGVGFNLLAFWANRSILKEFQLQSILFDFLSNLELLDGCINVWRFSWDQVNCPEVSARRGSTCNVFNRLNRLIRL